MININSPFPIVKDFNNNIFPSKITQQVPIIPKIYANKYLVDILFLKINIDNIAVIKGVRVNNAPVLRELVYFNASKKLTKNNA